MGKALIKPSHPNYDEVLWMTDSIYHNGYYLNNYLDDRVPEIVRCVKNGQRNTWYVLAKILQNTTGSGNAGEVEIKVSSYAAYGLPSPITFCVDRGGFISIPPTSSMVGNNCKELHTYKDGEYIYICLWAANYNDGFRVDIVSGMNYTPYINWRMTDAEFVSWISNKTRIDFVDRNLDPLLDVCRIVAQGEPSSTGAAFRVSTWHEEITSRNIKYNASGGNVKIEAGVRAIEISGMICGHGKANCYIMLTDETGKQLNSFQTMGILEQPSGNLYWKQNLSPCVYKLNPGLVHYVELYASGYNDTFTLNTGFGNSSWLQVKRLV